MKYDLTMIFMNNTAHPDTFFCISQRCKKNKSSIKGYPNVQNTYLLYEPIEIFKSSGDVSIHFHIFLFQ